MSNTANTTPPQGQELSLTLALKLIEATNGAPHAVALEALLALFISMAERHPCCTAGAALACGKAADHLSALALCRPGGANLH